MAVAPVEGLKDNPVCAALVSERLSIGDIGVSTLEADLAIVHLDLLNVLHKALRSSN